MAFAETGTKLANLVNPEVIGDMIDKKLIDLIKFAPLAKIDSTLVGQPGSVIKLPYYSYIGDAAVVAEGADIPIKQLSETTVSVQISKIGNGVQISDEAILSGYGDPLGQAATQIAMSIASKVDTDLVTALDGNTVNTLAITSTLTADNVADALVKFGEDIDGPMIIAVNADTYAALRKASAWAPASEIAANIIMTGVVGQVHGCQVVVSNRIKTNSKVTNFHIVKPGALAVYLKRDTMVETDRDIVNKSTVITADKHFATYLLDSSKAIKITQTLA